MKSIRVLVNGLSDNNGGIETCILNYCSVLVKKGFIFDFITTCKTVARQEQIKNWGGDIYQVVKLGSAPGQYVRQVGSIIKSGKYDVVWDNRDSLNNPVFLIIAKHMGVPIRIIHGHTMNNLGGRLRQVLHNINKKVLVMSAANRYWAASEASGIYFFGKKRVDRGLISIIPNCIDYNEYMPDDAMRGKRRLEFGFSPKDNVIIMVGGLVYPKNQELIIEALKHLNKDNYAWKLVLVGKGPDEEKLKNICRKQGLMNDVVFTGMVANVPELLQAADVFVMSSYHEGLAIAFVEAQVAGLPCVVSDTIPREAFICDNNVTVSPYEKAVVWSENIRKMNGKRKEPNYIGDGKRRFNLSDNGDSLARSINGGQN